MPAVPMSTTPEPNNIAALIAHLTSIIAWGNAFVRPTMLYARNNAKQNNMTPNTRLPHGSFKYSSVNLAWLKKARKKARLQMKEKAKKVSKVKPYQAPAVTAAFAKEEVKPPTRMRKYQY